MNLIISDRKANTKLPRVMRAALRLFVQKGIDGTTIKDIAREAKVAEGSLYRHYKSKEDLAWDLFKTHLSDFTHKLMRKVLQERTSQDRVRRFVEESFAAYEDDPELFTYLILREHSELAKYSSANEIHPGHLVIHIIEDGQKAGEIKAGDPYLLGSLFVGAVIRVCAVKMYGNLKNPLKTYAADVSESIWNMVSA